MSENAQGTAPKKQNRKATVAVVQNVTTAIQVGRDNYLLKGTEDGRGVRLENKQGGVFIPYGAGGKAIIEQLTAQVEAGSGRKRRRTAAEILAAKADSDTSAE
jgi:hypothetical protein